MKSFTSQEIELTRDYFLKKGFQELTAQVGGHEFSYFVLPQSLEPRLPNFVYRCTGENPDEYVFGISDSVPEEMREYAIAHEFIEFTKIGINKKGRCAQALDAELNLVPNEIRKVYIRMRRDFFTQLIEYCRVQPENYTPEDLQEFRNSLAKLEIILAKPNS